MVLVYSWFVTIVSIDARVVLPFVTTLSHKLTTLRVAVLPAGMCANGNYGKALIGSVSHQCDKNSFPET